MGKQECIRVWKDMDLEDLKSHLLIAGDPQGDCANCREVGINISDAKLCPKCGTEFKYIATRLAGGPSQAKRLKTKRPDLIAIELSDFKKAQSRNEAQRFME